MECHKSRTKPLQHFKYAIQTIQTQTNTTPHKYCIILYIRVWILDIQMCVWIIIIIAITIVHWFYRKIPNTMAAYSVINWLNVHRVRAFPVEMRNRIPIKNANNTKWLNAEFNERCIWMYICMYVLYSSSKRSLNPVLLFIDIFTRIWGMFLLTEFFRNNNTKKKMKSVQIWWKNQTIHKKYKWL